MLSGKVDRQSKRRTYIILFVIIAAAFALRFIGFNWGGDGTTYHPDEKKTYWHAMVMARNASPLSSSIEYPAQLTQKLLAVLYVIYRGVAHMAGSDWTEVGCIYIARILMAVYGTLAVYFGYRAGESLKKGSGLAVAFVIAGFGPLTAQAHNAVMDEHIGLLTVLAVLLAIRYLEADTRASRLIRLALLSAVCSIATLEKWYGAILCTVIVIAVAIKGCKKGARFKAWLLHFVTGGIFSVICYVVTFGIIAPNLLLHPGMVYDGIMHMSFGYTHDSPPLYSLATELGWFIAYAGILSAGFVAFAIAFFFIEKNKKAIVLLIGIIQPAFMAATGRPAHIRWIQPMFMGLLITLGIGITYAAQLAAAAQKKLRYGRIKCVIARVLIAVTCLNVISNGFLMTAVYAARESDTTNISEAYLKAHDIAPENCIYDSYTCIRPAGVGKYYDSVNVDDSFIELDGERYVIKLGRDYALSRDSYMIELENIAVFAPDYEFNKNTSHRYSYPSLKWLEPYSIWEALYYGIGIACGRLSTGMTYRLDDISMIPGVQYFEPGEFTLLGDDYECHLSAVNSGRYEVKLYDNGSGIPDELPLYIKKSDDSLLAETTVIDGSASLEIDEGGIDLVISIPAEYARDALPNIEIREKE